MSQDNFYRNRLVLFFIPFARYVYCLSFSFSSDSHLCLISLMNLKWRSQNGSKTVWPNFVIVFLAYLKALLVLKNTRWLRWFCFSNFKILSLILSSLFFVRLKLTSSHVFKNPYQCFLVGWLIVSVWNYLFSISKCLIFRVSTLRLSLTESQNIVRLKYLFCWIWIHLFIRFPFYNDDFAIDIGN